MGEYCSLSDAFSRGSNRRTPSYQGRLEAVTKSLSVIVLLAFLPLRKSVKTDESVDSLIKRQNPLWRWPHKNAQGLEQRSSSMSRKEGPEGRRGPRPRSSPPSIRSRSDRFGFHQDRRRFTPKAYRIDPIDAMIDAWKDPEGRRARCGHT